jgi:hypothetical protein
VDVAGIHPRQLHTSSLGLGVVENGEGVVRGDGHGGGSSSRGVVDDEAMDEGEDGQQAQAVVILALPPSSSSPPLLVPMKLQAACQTNQTEEIRMSCFMPCRLGCRL